MSQRVLDSEIVRAPHTPPTDVISANYKYYSPLRNDHLLWWTLVMPDGRCAYVYRSFVRVFRDTMAIRGLRARNIFVYDVNLNKSA